MRSRFKVDDDRVRRVLCSNSEHGLARKVKAYLEEFPPSAYGSRVERRWRRGFLHFAAAVRQRS